MRYDTLSTVGNGLVKSDPDEIWPYTDYENISISYLDLLKEDPCFSQFSPNQNHNLFSSSQSNFPIFNTDPIPSTS